MKGRISTYSGVVSAGIITAADLTKHLFYLKDWAPYGAIPLHDQAVFFETENGDIKSVIADFDGAGNTPLPDIAGNIMPFSRARKRA